MRVAVAYFNELKKEDLIWTLLQAGYDAQLIDLPISIYSIAQSDARSYADCIRESSIEAVLTYDFSAALSDGCQMCGIPYVSWIYDCPQKALYEAAVSNDCNYIFSFDKRQVEIIRRCGGKHVFYQPLGTNIFRNSRTVITRDDKEKYSCDISFVGNLFTDGIYELCEKVATGSTKNEYEMIMRDAYGKWDGVDRIHNKLSDSAIDNLLDIGRKELTKDFRMDLDEYFGARLLAYKLAEKERTNMLSRLAPYGIKFYTGEKSISIPGITSLPPIDYMEELPKLYNLSKININITLHSITEGIPLRVFDIMGAGGFVLSNYQPAIEEEFEIDKEIVVYKDLDEMEDKVRYYLFHEDARQKISINGNKAVTKRFNNEKLVKFMIEKAFNCDEVACMSGVKERIRQLIETGNMEEAYSEISRNLRGEIDFLKEDPEYCVLAATAFMARGEYDRALDIITMGLLSDNHNYELYLMLGEYYATVNLNQALLCFYQSLYYCDKEEDRAVIIEYITNVVDQGASIRPVSFVIVSCNESEKLRKCLDSIMTTVPAEVLEIIVIDNASDDGTREWLSEYGGITCGFSEERIGYVEALNEGIKLCSQNNDVMILDADAFLIDNTLFYLKLGMCSDEKIGIVGTLTNDYISDQKMTTGTDDLVESIRIASTVNSPLFSPLERSAFVSDFGMLINRNTLDVVGLFDEKYTKGIYSAKDYCMRVNKAGMAVMLAFNSYIFKTCDRDVLYSITQSDIDIEKKIFRDKWGFNADYSNNPRKDIINLISENEDAELKILELGCAMGGTLNRIKRIWTKAKTYGVEYDNAVVEIAKTMGNVIQGDIENMDIPYEKGKFDYIIYADVLEHLRNPEDTIKRFLPYLKDSGHIIVSLPNIRNHAVMQLLLLHGRFDYEDEGILDRTHLRFFTRDTAIKMLESSGFNVERIERNYNKCPERVEFIEQLKKAFEVFDSEELRVFQYQFLCRKK
nr:DUF3880 domain-containing protein [uncultured Butyrivibrio sp.]